MNHYDIIIIGGNGAGMSAASQARRINKSISIAVFEKSRFISYAACGMPYFIANEVDDYKKLIAVDKDDFIQNKNIQIFTESEAVKVDYINKNILIKKQDTEATYTYNKLIIATGAKAFKPPIQGIDNDNIFMLRNLHDAIAIKKFISEKNPTSAVLIGGGFIGLEMAEALTKLNIKTTILEKMESIAMTMSQEIREKIMDKLKEKSVIVQTNISISKIEKSTDKLVIYYNNNNKITTDLIIVSIGVIPNTDFLKSSEIICNDKGAIIVDEKSETNLKDIYAAGDCATVKNLIINKDVYMPLGTTANKQGRVAGLQAVGIKNEIFKGIVGSQLVKVFDLEIGKTGLNLMDAERYGIKAESNSSLWKSRAGYYPSTQDIFLNITINKDTREIIGGEIIGTDGAALRTNVIAAAITSKMKIEDFAYLDLGYAPPFSPVWDSLNGIAHKFIKRTN